MQHRRQRRICFLPSFSFIACSQIVLSAAHVKEKSTFLKQPSACGSWVQTGLFHRSLGSLPSLKHFACLCVPLEQLPKRKTEENQLLVAIHGSEMLLLSQHHLSSCWAYQLCCSALLGVKAMDPLYSRRWVIRPVLMLGLVSWCQGLTQGDNIPTSVSACYLLVQIASCRLKGRHLVQTELQRYR